MHLEIRETGLRDKENQTHGVDDIKVLIIYLCRFIKQPGENKPFLMYIPQSVKLILLFV